MQTGKRTVELSNGKVYLFGLDGEILRELPYEYHPPQIEGTTVHTPTNEIPSDWATRYAPQKADLIA